MFATPSTRTRTTVGLATTAALAVTLLGMTACTAQSAGKTSAPTTTTGSTIPAAAQTAPSSPIAPPQSWLAPAQVPFDSTVHWNGGTDSSAHSGVSALSQQPIVYPCANHGYQAVAHSASGFTTNTYTGSGTAGFDQTATATQSHLTYPTATAAHNAFQAIKQDLAGCAAQSAVVSANTNRPMTGTETDTANTADSLAYTYILRDNQGQPAQENGNYGAASDYHAYAVVNGATLEILWLGGGPVIDDTSNDAALLQTLAGTLN
jgi:hypothetical protein